MIVVIYNKNCPLFLPTMQIFSLYIHYYLSLYFSSTFYDKNSIKCELTNYCSFELCHIFLVVHDNDIFIVLLDNVFGKIFIQIFSNLKIDLTLLVRLHNGYGFFFAHSLLGFSSQDHIYFLKHHQDLSLFIERYKP